MDTQFEIITDSVERPSLDDRKYRDIRLKNGLEALLVHDPETDKASASLDVNVGDFSNDDGMPGLAHAVEHMLFMGTKKFPLENEYGEYLAANSGSYNAYTASTSTNYYFDVAAKPANDENPSATNPSPLREALDRFAQFFIKPLFLPNTLERELKAVDSENKKNLQDDHWRLKQLDRSLSNPNHPYSRFDVGSLEVLQTIPEASGIDVRDKFIEFHGKQYSANRMKLVILGRESLDVLQDWTVEFFSGIANKSLAPNRWTEELPFRECDVGVQCFAKPVMDSRELILCFPFIDEENLYASQPSTYCSHLISHEGPGSIMSHLKKKGWANSLSADAYSICPGTPGVFKVKIRLTEKGLKVYRQIISIFFQYIALLREASPQEWIFEEQKEMADRDFKFREKGPVSQFTRGISSVMQRPLPREWLLSSERLRIFDVALIEQALSKFRPENLRLFVVSRTFPGNWDKKEEWYGTEYSYGKIPEDVMEDWTRAINLPSKQRLSELHLPRKNIFITEILGVEKKEVLKPALAPRILLNDAAARTWWKKDDTFWVPKANVNVSLKNPLIYGSVQNSVKVRLFTELVRDALEENFYDAKLAGLKYTVSPGLQGMYLEISGYNNNLLILLEHITSTLRDIEIRDDRFAIVKERFTRCYDNWPLESPYQQVGEYTSWLNAEHDYLLEDLDVELRELTADDIRQFQKQILAQMYTEVYVHGNMSKRDALEVTEVVQCTIKSRVLPKSQLPIIRSLILPPGSNYVYKRTLKDPANVNHCVETLFYVGDRGDRSIWTKTLLIDQMMRESAFDQLRTREQLGYIVSASIRYFATTCGFRFLIQSERSPDYLDRRIEAFLVWFGETLQNMTDAEFEGHKRSMIMETLEKLPNLDQETSRHWEQITSEYYDFEQAQHDADCAKLLTKGEMLEFFDRYFSPSSSSRARLSVHLYAQGSSELDSKVVDFLKELGQNDVPKESRASLDLLETYLKRGQSVPHDQRTSLLSQFKELGLPQAFPEAEASSNESAIDSAIEITDVRQYKAGLQVSTGARSVKNLEEFEDIDPKIEVPKHVEELR